MNNEHIQSGEATPTQRNALDWNIRTDAMPSDMQILLADYPRDAWENHAGFKQKTAQWLGAHQMFKRLIRTVRQDTEQYIDGEKDIDAFCAQLSYLGGALVSNLHGHHSWEDNHFFPELSQADARFDTGLQILEKDHTELDKVLDAFAAQGNKLIKLASLEDARLLDSAGRLHSLCLSIEALLERHLDDEEELAVPIILHYRLRG